MAVERLSDELTNAGGAMLRELDSIGLHPQGVLWLFAHHIRDWRLSVVSDLVDEIGRPALYDTIGKALEKHGPIEGLTIFDVHLFSPSEIIPRVLGGAFRIQGGGPATLENCVVNDLLVDAVVYRLMPSRGGAKLKAAVKSFQRQARVYA